MKNFALHVIVDDTADTPEGANGAESVYALDVDGDGDVDVLSASSLDDKIAWYENDGDGSFALHVIVDDTADTPEGANGAESVYALDVDGDGDVDVLSASYYDDKIAWYENVTDNCLNVFNPEQTDTDGDGIGDACDACATVADPCASNETCYDVGAGYACCDSAFACSCPAGHEETVVPRAAMDGKASTWNLLSGNYNFAWSRNLYLPEEVGGLPGAISAIALQVETASAFVFDDVEIYLKLAGDQVAYESDAPPPADMTGYVKSFDGALSFSEVGWREVALETDFAFDGTSSLEVVFLNKSGTSSTEKPFFAYKADLTHARMVRHFGEATGRSFRKWNPIEPAPQHAVCADHLHRRE